MSANPRDASSEPRRNLIPKLLCERIEAKVVTDHSNSIGLLPRFYDPAGVSHTGGDRLLQIDVSSVAKCGDGGIGVKVRRQGDNDRINGVRAEEVVDRLVVLRARSERRTPCDRARVRIAQSKQLD